MFICSTENHELLMCAWELCVRVGVVLRYLTAAFPLSRDPLTLG